MTTDLVPKQITPKEVFVPNGLDPILKGVRLKVKEFEVDSLDMEKKPDRDKLRTFSMDIGRSRKFIDDQRKLYVKDKKAELKIIDQECKTFRDTMDQIKIETRQPLTDYEDAEKKRNEEERLAEIAKIEAEEKAKREELEAREKAIAEKEAEMARLEQERKDKEEADRLEKERIDREERLKKEAAERAEREAEEKIRVEREEKERVEREMLEAQEQAERDRIAAEEKAKAEQKAAVQKAKDDAAAKAQAEKEAEAKRIAEEKAKADKKAANKRHQASINNKIKECLMKIDGVDEKMATDIITATAKHEIDYLRILY
ncbi:MAG: hypothetical protein GY941_23585 [Planctomycetes bacterium]|nr:hypothetical protein [Planctomycetota bacterium]